MQHLRTQIRHVPDFPKPGILFYDITTLLRDAAGLRQTIDGLSEPFRDKQIDLVVGIESRGFILGCAIADRLGAGFVPVRKPGKLPGNTIEQSYELTNPDGVTVCVGVPRIGDNISIYSLPLHFKKRFTGSHGGDSVPDLDIPRYIKLIKAGKMSLDGLITHEFSLEEINEALDLVRSGEVGRVMINMT